MSGLELVAAFLAGVLMGSALDRFVLPLLVRCLDRPPAPAWAMNAGTTRPIAAGPTWRHRVDQPDAERIRFVLLPGSPTALMEDFVHWATMRRAELQPDRVCRWDQRDLHHARRVSQHLIGLVCEQ